MYARVTTFRGPPDTVTEDIRAFQERLIPAARQQPGFRGAYVLLDQTSRQALAIALWHKEEDLHANEAMEAAEGPAVAVYEVAVAPPTLTGISPMMLAPKDLGAATS